MFNKEFFPTTRKIINKMLARILPWANALRGQALFAALTKPKVLAIR